jgi:hypothetical protein
MKTKRHGFYLWTWQEVKGEQHNYGCNGCFKSFIAAERQYLFVCSIHKDKLIRGEIRCEIG